MADIVLNFSSQWPSMQVARVIRNPETAGVADTSPYIRKVPHGLGYPPLAIGMGVAAGTGSYNPMEGVDVDDTYIYVKSSTPLYDCIVVYALDISREFDYTNYESATGTVLEDTSGGALDLRDFLLHSRAVSPMVLSVKTKIYTTSDLAFSYTHPLSYAIFNFGYVRISTNDGSLRSGIWKNAPLQSQSFPWLNTNGFTSSLGSTIVNSVLAADRGSIITLRNPAIVTNNTSNVVL